MRKQIELCCGFEELRTILNEFEEDKIWKSNKEMEIQEGVESQLPTIQEGENDFGAVFSGNLGNGGNQSSIPEQHEANNETLGNVGMGWG